MAKWESAPVVETAKPKWQMAPEAANVGAQAQGPNAGLAIPGTTPTEGYVNRDGKWYQATPKGLVQVDGPPQSRTFGAGSSDTINPLPAIAAGADRAVGSIPIVGERLTDLRDQVNANIHGDTPAAARTDMNKNVEANPVPAKIGEAVGQASPWIAAAPFAPLAGALGLEGSILSRLIMGTASNVAIKTGDKMSKGENPIDAVVNATNEGVLEAPFFLLGTKSGKQLRQQAVATAPKTKDLFEQGSQLYEAAKDSKLVIAQPNAKTFIDSTTAKAQSAGLDEELTKGATSVIKRMQTMTNRNMSIDDALLLRKLANDAFDKAEAGTNDARISRMIVRDIDKFLEGVASKGPNGEANMAVVAGDPGMAKTALDEANKAWSTASKAKAIDRAVELAVQKAEESGRSLEATLKSEFGRLDREIIKDNPEHFLPDEVKLIQEVARGKGARNLGSYLGRVLYPNGPVSAVSSMTAGLMSGGSTLMSGASPILAGVATVAPMAIGAVGRSAASRSAKRSADYASAYLRNKGAGSQFAPAVEAPPIIKALPGVVGRSTVQAATVAPAMSEVQR